jgi:hypothetical protein
MSHAVCFDVSNKSRRLLQLFDTIDPTHVICTDVIFNQTDVTENGKILEKGIGRFISRILIKKSK